MMTVELIQYLKQNFQLNWTGVHGSPHWARVKTNGFLLAEQTGASTRVVELFSFLHDSMRLNDYTDSEHGRRASQLVYELNDRFYLLCSEELQLLSYACEHHSNGLTEADITVQTCWDADRLDLGRVGIKPSAHKLCTPAARDSDVIEWAYKRSIASVRSPDR